VIAGLTLPGTAHDVAVAGDLVYIATGAWPGNRGRFRGSNPILLGQLDLPGGIARSVSVDAVRQLPPWPATV
jgi:hypothetical protein